MPEFVKHEEDWKRARKEADSQNIPKKNDAYWKYVTAIYRKMHPEDFSKKANDVIREGSRDLDGVQKEYTTQKQTYDLKTPKGYDFSKPFSKGVPTYASSFKWFSDLKPESTGKVPFPGAVNSTNYVVTQGQTNGNNETGASGTD